VHKCLIIIYLTPYATSQERKKCHFSPKNGKFSNVGYKFPDLMAAALSKQDINLWAAKEELIIKK